MPAAPRAPARPGRCLPRSLRPWSTHCHARDRSSAAGRYSPARLTLFRHGVASADPLPDGVLLWTRCTTGGTRPFMVEWWIGPTPEAADATAGGLAEASPERDFTVHVDVRGLDPATTYWYGFRAMGMSSLVGRTRTAPALDTPVDRLRLGLTSCAHWSCGFFNAYAAMADRDLDLVVHVGDYIYENDKLRQ